LWRVAVNILSKQSQTADKGWFYSMGVGQWASNSIPLKPRFLQIVTQGLRNGQIF